MGGMSRIRCLYINNDEVFWDQIYMRPMCPNVRKILVADTISVYVGYISGVPVNVYHDPEPRPHLNHPFVSPTCLDEAGNIVLKGNVAVFGRGDDGEDISLDGNDMVRVMNSMYLGISRCSTDERIAVNTYYLQPLTDEVEMDITDIEWS